MTNIEGIREKSQAMITALTRCHLSSAENAGFRECEGCSYEDHQKSTCSNELGREGIALLKDMLTEVTRLTAERDAAEGKALEQFKGWLQGHMSDLRAVEAARDKVIAECEFLTRTAPLRGVLEADRDRWKARAEALRSAMMLYGLACPTCTKAAAKGGMQSCCNGCCPGYRNWQLDEARFSGEEGTHATD